MANVVMLRCGDREFRVEAAAGRVLVDGVEVAVPSAAVAIADGERRWVFLGGNMYEFEVQRRGRRRTAAHHSSLTAPMPATVTRINVAPGATVKKGDTLVVLEAMKMELPVRAPSDGTVTTVSCRQGDLVQPGVTLVEIDA